MKQHFDDLLSNYFEIEQPMSAEVKKELHEKLVLAEQKRNEKQLWLSVILIMVFSLLTAAVISIFIGSTLLHYTLFVGLFISFISSALIVFLSRKEQTGGKGHVVLD